MNCDFVRNLDYKVLGITMAAILVSLIGDQTAPNLFFMLEQSFQHVEQYIFLTTAQMRGKRRLQHLVAAAGIDKNTVSEVVVIPDNVLDIQDNLAQLNLTEDDQYYINLTGGTKMMSIAVFDFFSRKDWEVQMYYVPIGKQLYWQIYPKESSRELLLLPIISLDAYLTSYGIQFVRRERLEVFIRKPVYTDYFMQVFLERERVYSSAQLPINKILYELGRTQNKYRRKSEQYASVPVEEVEGLDDFLKTIQFIPKKPNALLNEEVAYLTGTWLEEWVYYRIKSVLKLEDSAIALNMTIRRGLTAMEKKNELDVVFLHQSRLYIIECKARYAENPMKIKSWLDPSLDKLGALRKDYGINVTVVLITISSLGKQLDDKKKNLRTRADDLGICLLDYNDLKDQSADTWVERIINF